MNLYLCKKLLRSFGGIATAIFVFIYGTVYLIPYYLQTRYGFDADINQMFMRIRIIILCVFAVLFGFFRTTLVNPFLNNGYLRWLAFSPWTADKPLPFGPVHLVWIDFLLLVVASVLSYVNNPVYWYAPVISFLAIYTAILICTLLVAGQHKLFVLILFLIPFVYYPHKDLRLTLAALIVLYFLSLTGFYMYMSEFPWNTRYWKADFVREWLKSALRRGIIGWPHKQLHDFTLDVHMGYFHSVVVSALMTWWLHIARWYVDDPYEFALLAIFILFIVLGRIGFCVYLPPISFWGRIRTGHLIIPRYDKVFIAPIVIIITGIFVPRLLINSGINNTLAFELTVFCVLFEGFILPPNLKDWRLTGAHRISRGPVQQNQMRRYHS
jgi:hypothetical protein